MVTVFQAGNKLHSPFLSYRKDVKTVKIPKELNNPSLRQLALKMWHEMNCGMQLNWVDLRSKRDNIANKNCKVCGKNSSVALVWPNKI